ncbi:hypothetical protein ACEN9F_00225 [Duganella sp. CT11-25]|uniref:hypothetical protein n=1 Tax=unclassified Duganella TaxID=2636909 RepID=UPI0039B0D007
METFKLRYFFDPGSGICLWSENELAIDKFGYAVELDSLEISSALKSQAEELIVRFDTSIGWNYPSDPSPWSDKERQRFETDSASLLQSLQECLGDVFEIWDCTR